MHLFTIQEKHPNDVRVFYIAPSLAAAVAVIPVSEDARKVLSGSWLPVAEGRTEWVTAASGTEVTVRKVQLNSDGSDAFDADVLELAAVILRKRYGIAITGDLVRALTGRAHDIREEQ